MKFDLNKINNQGKGSRNRKFTDEELIEAVNSGLFTSKAAIARYFEVSPAAIYARIKKLQEKGMIE